VAGDHRLPDRRRLWAERNLGRRHCNPTDSEAYTGSIGLPMPNVEIKILDDEGQEVRSAIQARSPSRVHR